MSLKGAFLCLACTVYVAFGIKEETSQVLHDDLRDVLVRTGHKYAILKLYSKHVERNMQAHICTVGSIANDI